jgi:ribosomal protein S18 acetylase RimI-like enzyme
MLRAALPADLPFVLRLERDYVRQVEPEAEAAWTAAIDRNLALWVDCLDRTLVLEVDGAPAGSVMWLAAGDDATLVGIHVLARHRRQGFGRCLLEAFAQQATAAGHKRLKLGVHRDNPAVRLYESAGYRFTGHDGAYRCYELSTPTPL